MPKAWSTSWKSVIQLSYAATRTMLASNVHADVAQPSMAENDII